MVNYILWVTKNDGSRFVLEKNGSDYMFFLKVTENRG